MQNPNSYVHSNIAGFVNLLEVCKSANPQPAIVWASSSSVYGLNSKVPFSEKDRTDQPLVRMPPLRKPVKKLHILTITYMVFQFLVCGFSLYMVLGVVPIWPISSSPKILLKESRLQFLRLLVMEQLREILPTLMIL
ncbi:hypothetical protein K1719_003053 [Acacia pycnantha]|nr:hypothetical protein K1719_003053 [Acacia pycnantha]